MVSVRSSSGKNVEVKITGIKETIERLKKLGMNLDNKIEKQIVSDGAKVAQEVQMSIAGKRDEKKSVDTGVFANSITVEKKNKGEVIVKPRNISYMNGTPVSLVALWMEEGTTNINPRGHFRGSVKRMKPKIKSSMELVVKGEVRKF
ncbi:MAG: hypothetical protein Q7R52_04385 [archaeon]|nr:hypothetical protein [archaeon]